MIVTRIVGTITAILGALMLLGVITHGGPVTGPVVVAALLISAGPTAAHLKRRRVHGALKARAERGLLGPV